jgi:quercetin dioxygenase-like cupin family protein
MLTELMLPLLLGCAPKIQPTVIPAAEVIQQDHGHTHGPEETKGIESVEALGVIDLQKEFDALSDPRVFRLRRLTLAPGASVAMHEHDQRPGVAYILSGEINEHRDGQPTPRRAGEWSFEQTGVTHGWHNQSESPVQALVVDVISPDPTLSVLPLSAQRAFTDAPSESTLLSMEGTATISLEAEDPAFAGKVLRLRVLSIEPGGIVGAHTHSARPGFVYLLEGELNEHRGDGDSTYHPGEVAIEQDGLSHWWENTTEQPATVLLVDIVDSPS